MPPLRLCGRVLLGLVLSVAGAAAQAPTPTPTPNNWSIVPVLGDSIGTGTRLFTDALPTPPDGTSTHLHLQGNDGQFHSGFVEPYKCESAGRCGAACNFGDPTSVPCGDQLTFFPYAASFDPQVPGCCPGNPGGGILYGPGQSIGMRLLALGLPEVDMIPCARGGTYTGEWMPGQPLYQSCLQRIITAQTRGPVYCNLINVGTNDAIAGGGGGYATALTTMMTNLHASNGAPVVFAELNNNPALAVPPNSVLAEQRSIVLQPWMYRLSANIPLGSDNIHPTTAGYRTWGQLYANACATLAPITPAATATPTVTPTAVGTPIPTHDPFSCPR